MPLICHYSIMSLILFTLLKNFTLAICAKMYKAKIRHYNEIVVYIFSSLIKLIILNFLTSKGRFDQKYRFPPQIIQMTHGI